MGRGRPSQEHTLQPCRIYPHTWHSTHGRGLERATPKGWLDHQYSFELHLQRRLVNHSWRVPDAASADVIFVPSNFTLMCQSGRIYQSFSDWETLREKEGLWAKNSSGTMVLPGAPPKFVAFQAGTCIAPWHNWQLPPDDLLTLLESQHTALEKTRGILGPFAVSQ